MEQSRLTAVEPLSVVPAPTAEPAPARAPRLWHHPLVLGTIAVAAIAGGASAYWVFSGRETTDDAHIDGEIVAVPARTSGVVRRIAFVENQEVKAGDLLAEIDDDAPRAKLAQAEAALEAARASAAAADADASVALANAVGNKAASAAVLATMSSGVLSADEQFREAEASLRAAEVSRAQAQIDRDRTATLAWSGAASRASVDQAETHLGLASSNLDAARARLKTVAAASSQARSRVREAAARAHQSNNVDVLVAQAKARAKAAHAQVETAQALREVAALELSYTKIHAPHDGIVSKKSIAEGQNVSAGQPVVQLVTPGVWVTANFKETQLARMRMGQPVSLKVDAFPGAKIEGELESLSGATGSKFALLPPDNASGNYTKIVQRVPVRIRVTTVPADVFLRPGMSVDARVLTRS